MGCRSFPISISRITVAIVDDHDSCNGQDHNNHKQQKLIQTNITLSTPDHNNDPSSKNTI